MHFKAMDENSLVKINQFSFFLREDAHLFWFNAPSPEIKTDLLYAVAISDFSMEDKYSARCRCHGYDREHIHTNRAETTRIYTYTPLLSFNPQTPRVDEKLPACVSHVMIVNVMVCVRDEHL